MEIAKQAIRMVVFDSNNVILDVYECDFFIKRNGTFGDGVSRYLAEEFLRIKKYGGRIEIYHVEGK